MLREDHRHTQLPVETLHGVEKFRRRNGVKLAGRFVEHEHIRVHCHHGREIEQLLLPAGERIHAAVKPRLDAEKARHLADAQPHGLRVRAETFQPEGQLVPHLVGDELVVRLLQHEADALRLCARVPRLQRLAVEQHPPAARAVGCEHRLQMPQQRALPAAGHAAQQEKLPLAHGKRDIVQRALHRLWVGESQMFDRKRRHVSASFRFSSRGRLQNSAKHARVSAPGALHGALTSVG